MKRPDGMVLIPAYCESRWIGPVIRDVRQYIPLVVVVDDGSSDDTAAVSREAGAVVLVHEVNQGKGAALRTGFQYAREQGMSFVLTMDGDGQHAATDIPVFLQEFAKGTFSVIIGNRMNRPNIMPRWRWLTNHLMSRFLSWKMGQYVPDTQNGFRLYRTDAIPDMPENGTRFASESEILLKLARRGEKIKTVSIRVIYGNEQSKIRPLRDIFYFFRMLKTFDREQKVNDDSKRRK